MSPADTLDTLTRFLKSRDDGVVISLTSDGPRVNRFQSERVLGSGVLPDVGVPYEPVFIGKMAQDRLLLEQFEGVLSNEPSEKQIEDFLVQNFQEVFGNKYSQIRSQVWMQCQGRDVGAKDRRLDIFLRNSMTSDWELIEIKKPIKLEISYRSIPSLAGEVHHAIQQTQNYLRLLSTDSVKQQLAGMGIDYADPVATLVIGRSSAIPIQEWNWLKKSNQHGVKIASFDDIENEWKERLRDRYELISRIQG
jgi:hypothetical protein